MIRAIAVVAAMLIATDGHVAAAEKQTVLVMGAGQSGQPLIKILADKGYNVRISSRKAADMPGATAVVADVTKPDTLPAALKGVDYVISTIGSNAPDGTNRPEDVDYKGMINLVDAAKAAKVKQFVLMSALGAGNNDPEVMLNKRFGMVLMWKGRGEDYLRKSGVPYTIVRPGGLKNCDPGKADIKFSGDPKLTGAAICRSDVGLAMAAALGNPQALQKTVGVVSQEGAPSDPAKKFAAINRDP